MPYRKNAVPHALPKHNMAHMMPITLNPWHPQAPLNMLPRLNDTLIETILSHITTEPEHSLSHALLVHHQKHPCTAENTMRLKNALSMLRDLAYYKQMGIPQTPSEQSKHFKTFAQSAYQHYMYSQGDTHVLEKRRLKLKRQLQAPLEKELLSFQKKLAQLPADRRAHTIAQLSRAFMHICQHTPNTPDITLKKALSTTDIFWDAIEKKP